jgi:[NiFe] hydrogenase diaphorase moiety small subunit
MDKNEKLYFEIDGTPCYAEEGQSIIDAARANGVFIPSLCHVEGVKPAGSCRVCNVKVKGRTMTACTTPVEDGMIVENDTPELNDLRKAIIETLFVSGNHLCPSCEKSGECELQALAYRFLMMVPRFPYKFPERDVNPKAGRIFHDQNRCVLCKRCIRTVTKDGKHVFAFHGRGGEHLQVVIDEELASRMTEQEAMEAMEICPVGAILKKERGFVVPIGEREYDHQPIGSEIEN